MHYEYYAVLFWLFYRDPRESRRFSENEHAYIVEGGAQQENITLENLLDSVSV